MNPVSPSEFPLTAERYLALAQQGVFGPDDRVELLEGVIVAMPPHETRHSAGVRRAHRALSRAVGERAVIQVQLSLEAGAASVPEPDVAILPGTIEDYDHRHPRSALLVVEVADSSLPQDRLTKSRIYAAAGIPEYWILNVRHGCLEVHRRPDVALRTYGERRVLGGGEEIGLLALPGAVVAVDDLLPVPRSEAGDL
ncbi:MAG: Uma2 family endonuclease [Candidatus Binatia bacterium]